MKKLMLTLAISMMFAPAAFAADATALATGADKTATMPAYGADKQIPTPKIVKKTLANGMTVWVVPRKGLPRVDYVLAVRGAGFAADARNNPGFANLLAGMINEGSARRDSRAIAEAAQGMGGSVAAGSASDGIFVSANAVSSQAAPMMSLLAEVTRMPNFPVKEVELAKANALQALRAAEATPRFRAERAINQTVYGEHPYGHTQPTAEAINSVTQEMLRLEHAKRFRPDRTLLVITGRIGEAEAMKLAQAAFGDWKAEGQALAETAPAPRAAKPARVLLQRANSVQSTIRVGGPASRPAPTNKCHCVWPAPSSAAASRAA